MNEAFDQRTVCTSGSTLFAAEEEIKMRHEALVPKNSCFLSMVSAVITAILCALLLSTAPPTEASAGGNRVMVLLNTDITDGLVAELSNYGTVHGWIDRYRLVAMTPHGAKRLAVIKTLPYVEYVETDQSGAFADVGTWDRDLIDAVDVEETGYVGDPDAREVEQTGAGVHIAVLDSGLVPDWRDLLDESRVETSLARSFMGGGNSDPTFPSNDFGKSRSNETMWERDWSGHGTTVASHIIGFKARGVSVDGVAPGAKVIPLKIGDNSCDSACTWTSQSIAALSYVVGLVEDGLIGPTVINMSYGWSNPSLLEWMVINDAIAAGIVVVAAAHNQGENGMWWPGAFPEVISAGAVGWKEQFQPGTLEAPNFDFWYTQDVKFDPDRGKKKVETSELFVTGYSSRAIPGKVPGFTQELDVLAPGHFTAVPRSTHGALRDREPVLPEIVLEAGTSISSPITVGVAALILEKNPTLMQADIEAILKSTALPMPAEGSQSEIIHIPGFPLPPGVYTFSWDTDCSDDPAVVIPCDPVGAGLLQADAALLSCALLMVLATWSPTHAQCGSDDVQLSARQIAGTAALLQWTSCGGPFFECFKIKDDPSSICSPEAKVQDTSATEWMTTEWPQPGHVIFYKVTTHCEAVETCGDFLDDDCNCAIDDGCPCNWTCDALPCLDDPTCVEVCVGFGECNVSCNPRRICADGFTLNEQTCSCEPTGNCTWVCESEPCESNPSCTELCQGYGRCNSAKCNPLPTCADGYMLDTQSCTCEWKDNPDPGGKLCGGGHCPPSYKCCCCAGWGWPYCFEGKRCPN
jgi:subtilisin family serine protease